MAHKKGTAALTTPPGQGCLMMFSPKRTARRSAGARHQGFTLVELMVVVAIIAIVAFFALPAYQDQVRKTRRTDAKTALSDLAARQEQYYTNNKTYADTLTKLGLGTRTTSEQGYYGLVITAGPTGSLTTSYDLTATAQGDQARDTKCAKFKLNSQGTKTSLDSGSAASSGCW